MRAVLINNKNLLIKDLYSQLKRADRIDDKIVILKHIKKELSELNKLRSLK